MYQQSRDCIGNFRAAIIICESMLGGDVSLSLDGLNKKISSLYLENVPYNHDAYEALTRVKKGVEDRSQLPAVLEELDYAVKPMEA